MLAINFNSRTPFHIDLNNNGLYIGEQKGEHLIFSYLDLRLKLVKGAGSNVLIEFINS